MSGIRKNFRELAVIAVLVTGGLILLTALASHRSTVLSGRTTHSKEWMSGYQVGNEMYQQTGWMGSFPPKNPQDIQLQTYCDESAVESEPNLSNLTQWLQGYDYACYGG